MENFYLKMTQSTMRKSLSRMSRFVFALTLLCALSNSVLMAQPLLPAQVTGAKGYWDFNQAGKLNKAKLGSDLITVGSPSAVKGIVPGDTAARVAFNDFFKFASGLSGNNGGSYLNKYTMVFDFKVLSVNNWHAFYQSDKKNSGDADCFINDGSGQIGTSKTGYSSKSVEPNKWHRLVIVADIQTLGGTYNYYLDGVNVNRYTIPSTQTLLDGRFSLQDTLLLFADNDGENDTMDVSSLAIFDRTLTEKEIFDMGEADPAIPKGFPNSLSAYWSFNMLSPLKASLGNNLILNGTHSRVAGPSEGDSAVRIGLGSYYKVINNLKANGGGNNVNNYSLMVDFKVKDFNSWYSFHQTDSTNTSDAESFIKKSAGTVGVGVTAYTPNPITANKWHRLIIAADNTPSTGTYSYYIDGALAHSINFPASPSFIDSRFSLDKVLLLFADNDGDDGEFDVNTVALFNQKLTLSEVQAIGMMKIDTVIEVDTAQVLSKTNWPNIKAYWAFQDTAHIYKGLYGSDDLIKKGPKPGSGNLGTGGVGGNIQKISGPSTYKKAIRTTTNTHLIAKHHIAPNGGVGAKRVNNYSIMVDFRVSYLKDAKGYNSFYSLFPGNDDDGAIFIDEDGGLGDGRSGGYSNPVVSAYKWNRLVVSVSCDSFYKIYLNGKLVKKTTPANSSYLGKDGIFSLDSVVLLRGDQDGEDSAMDVSTFAIFDKPLSDYEVAMLGGVPQPSSQVAGTSVQLVHNSLDVDLSAVDVYIDGYKMISTLPFRYATPYTAIPSGNHRIAISKSGSAIDTSWSAKTLNFKADSAYVLMLTGVKDTASYLRKSTGGVNSGASIKFKYALSNTQSVGQTGTVNLLLFHGSTDISPVRIFDPAVGSATDSLVYGRYNIEGSSAIPTYPYVIQVQDRVTGKALKNYYSSIENHDGEAVTFMLSGVKNTTGNKAGAAKFGLYKVLSTGGPAILLDTVPLPPKSPKMQVIHNAADPSTQNIDIWIDGNKAFSNMSFRKGSPFLPFKVKDVKVLVYKAGTTTPILDSMTLSLKGDKQYILMLAGVNDTTQFNRKANSGAAIKLNMVLFDQAQKVSGDTNKINTLFFNGACDMNDVSLVEASSSTTLIDRVKYGTYDASYRSINKGLVKWNLRSTATGTTNLRSYGYDLKSYGGKSMLLFTSGFLTTNDEQTGSPALAICGLDSLGKVFVFTDFTGLNESSSVENAISVYPNPAHGVLHVFNNSELAANIKIIDINGKVVVNQLVESNNNDIDISHFNNGIYFYEVVLNGTIVKGKISVQ